MSALFHYRNEEEVVLRDKQFITNQGEFANNIGRILFISGCKRVVLDNLVIKGGWDQGTLGYGPDVNHRWFVGILVWDCDSLVVNNCDVSGVSGAGIQAIGVRNARINGNYVHHCGRDGIASYAIARSDNGYLKRGYNISIVGNTAEYLGDDAIAIWDASMDANRPPDHISNVSICGNTIDLCPELTPKMLGRGIALGGLSHFAVTGNVVKNTPYSGVLCTSSHFNKNSKNYETKEGLVTNNTVINAGNPLGDPEYLKYREFPGDHFRYGVQLFGHKMRKSIAYKPNTIVRPDLGAYYVGIPWI